MGEFNVHRWFKDQYLQENDDPKMGAELEAGLDGTGVAENEGMSLPSPNFFYAIHKILKNFLDEKAVEAGDRMSYFSAEFPLSTAFESYMRKQLEGTQLNEAEEMATYKVTVTLAEPGEGGPDYDEDVEVKVDASLSGDELKSAVRDAIGKEGYNRKNIYKFKYEKA